MLNYIRAELWKVFRRKSLYLLTGIMLLGDCLFSLTVWVPAGQGRAIRIAAILEDLLPVGLLLALVLAGMVFNDQYKHGTLKNEITFGVSRARIYFGKELSALLIGVVCAGIVVGCFLLLAVFLPEAGAAEEVSFALSEALFQTLCALPLWIGGLGLACALAFQLRSGGAAAVIYVLALIWMSPALELIALNADPAGAVWRAVEFIRLWTLTGPFEHLKSLAAGEGRYLLPLSWMVGMAWFWGSSAVGLALFRRKTIV